MDWQLIGSDAALQQLLDDGSPVTIPAEQDVGAEARSE